MGTLMVIHNDEIAALLRKDFKEIIKLRRKLAATRDRKAVAIDFIPGACNVPWLLATHPQFF